VPASPTASITLTPPVPSPTAQPLAPADASSQAVVATPTVTATPTAAATPTPTSTTVAAVTHPPEAPYPDAMAPDFTLDSAQGSPVTLSDYRGKSYVVLFFHRGST